MSKMHVVHRTLVIGATAAALVFAAFGSTGCRSQVKAAAPTTTPVAAIGAPTSAQLAQQPGGGMHGTAPVAAASTTTPPAVAKGQAVIETSCIKAKCHTDKLLSYRTSQAKAKQIVGSMAGRSKVTAWQKNAVVEYFTQ